MREILALGAALWLANSADQAKGQGKPLGKVPPLKTTELEDGTGTIGLPAGWRIDGSYRGTVGCVSPEGARVIMGMAWTIGIPEHPANNLGIPYKGAMASEGDLSGALRSVLKTNGSRLISLRSRPAPEGLPGVPAVYFVYEMESRGRLMTAMGYFSSVGGPSDGTLPYWQLYSSAIMAPKDRFMKDYPTMMAMWNSWRPNGQKPREGSNGALIDATRKAIDAGRAKTLKDQQEAFDRMTAKWKAEVLR